MTNKNSKIEEKSGLFEVFFRGDVGFWGIMGVFRQSKALYPRKK